MRGKMEKRIEDLEKLVTKLKVEVAERDTVISSNYDGIQNLRRKIQELEKHKFVLGYRAESYQKELQPMQKENNSLQKSLVVSKVQQAPALLALARISCLRAFGALQQIMQSLIYTCSEILCISAVCFD